MLRLVTDVVILNVASIVVSVVVSAELCAVQVLFELVYVATAAVLSIVASAAFFVVSSVVFSMVKAVPLPLTKIALVLVTADVKLFILVKLTLPFIKAVVL